MATPVVSTEDVTVTPSTTTSGSWLAVTSWRVWTSLVSAWSWFDKNVGWAIGLDEPKYKWAILEHERLKREEHEEIFHGEAAQSKAVQDNTMEGGSSAMDAPVPDLILPHGTTATAGRSIALSNMPGQGNTA